MRYTQVEAPSVTRFYPTHAGGEHALEQRRKQVWGWRQFSHEFVLSVTQTTLHHGVGVSQEDIELAGCHPVGNTQSSVRRAWQVFTGRVV